jgi:flagellar protein FlgJ
MSVQLDAAFNYNDLQGLETLKVGARDDDPKALQAVAQQFESMFISLIMKSMRDATDVMASDLESSYQTKFYRDMHDQQLSLSLSQNGGFGLAEILYEQLAESQNPSRPDLYSIDVKGMDESNRPILPFTGLDASTQSMIDNLTSNLSPETSDELAALANSFLQEHVMNEAPEDITLQRASSSQLGKSEVFTSPEDFIEKVLPVAEKAAKALNLEPKFLVAQAALETGWGKYVIDNEQGKSSYNFFGIKADQRWQGDSATATTHEFIEGKKLTVKEPFRSYNSIEESFNDYVDFISGSERYKAAVASSDNGETYAKELQNAGYATDPKYAEKIARIANSDWFSQS